MMVGRRPCISCEMNTAWVILKEFRDTFAALQVGSVDVASNSAWRWDLSVGVSSREEIDEFRIGSDGCRAIAFGYPFRNVGTNVHKSKKNIQIIWYIPEFRGRVRTMRIRNRVSALGGESTENVTAPAATRLPPYSLINRILAEAANCMVTKVSS